MEPKQIFVCQNCFRQHVRNMTMVDEQIECECGHRFLAFGNEGLTLTLPASELRSFAVVNAIRRMIASTGRCPDAPVSMVNTESTQAAPVKYERVKLDPLDPVKLMETGLRGYQMETFGIYLLTLDKVISICESLNEDADVEIKKQREKVNIYEVKLKKKM